MEAAGETVIGLPPDRLWRALHEPDILKACIHRCEAVTREAERRYVFFLKMKLGPVKVPTQVVIEIDPLDPPHRYDLLGESGGRLKGLARGRAAMTLAPRPDGGTDMRYRASAQLAGFLAEFAPKTVQKTVDEHVEKFFGRFEAEIRARDGAGNDSAIVP